MALLGRRPRALARPAPSPPTAPAAARAASPAARAPGRGHGGPYLPRSSRGPGSVFWGPGARRRSAWMTRRWWLRPGGGPEPSCSPWSSPTRARAGGSARPRATPEAWEAFTPWAGEGGQSALAAYLLRLAESMQAHGSALPVPGGRGLPLRALAVHHGCRQQAHCTLPIPQSSRQPLQRRSPAPGSGDAAWHMSNMPLNQLMAGRAEPPATVTDAAPGTPHPPTATTTVVRHPDSGMSGCSSRVPARILPRSRPLSRDRTRCPRCPASRCTTRCRHRPAGAARAPRRARPAVRIRPPARPGAVHPRARCPPARQDAAGS
jgi:hypothetical protein